MQMKDNAGGSHLFCTGRHDQPGAETSMENKILIKCEINSDTHPKASCHAARIESCYTITPASFSLLAAKPHNCGCVACQAYIWENLAMRNTYVGLYIHHRKTHEPLFILYPQCTEHHLQAA